MPVAVGSTRAWRPIRQCGLSFWLGHVRNASDCLIIAAEFVHGIARAVFLVPYVGDSQSRQIGVVTGSVLFLLIACLTTKWLRADRTSLQIQAGSTWVVLTLAFELGFGHFVMRVPWNKLVEDYNVQRGGLLPLGLLGLSLSPLIAARLDAHRNPVSRRSESKDGRGA
jgi:hypothetical protein